MNIIIFIFAIIAGLLFTPRIQAFFIEDGGRWMYVLLVSFSLSFCLTPLCAWIARRFDIVDTPDFRKAHSHATPLLGGCAVFIAFFAAILINNVFSSQLWAILIAAAVLFVTGLIDDCKEVSAKSKLVIQIMCTAFIISYGIILDVIPDKFGIFSKICNIILTFLWIVGITNAMNFFDGMDGLAAGLSAIIAFFLGVVAFQTRQPFLGWISVSMMGSCMGFLPHNFKIRGEASIFLGDAGSTVMGFILACLAVYGDWATNDPIAALISPLLIFWLLIFDMIHITVDRIITQKVSNLREWIEYVGKDHLHHRLADVLGGKKKSVLFIYLLNLCLGVSAVVLRDSGSLDALLLLIQACVIVVLITILERRGRSLGRNKLNV